MIDGLQPYAQTRPTDLCWLPTIPAHWPLIRTRFLFREIDNRSVTGTETHLSMSQKLGLVPDSEIDQKTLVSDSYVGAKLVKQHDLVLNRLKAHLGVFSVAKQAGLVSPDYSVFRPVSTGTARFFEYVLKSSACRTELRIRAKGIVEGFWRLYTPDFNQIKLPVPPSEEQRLIVRFLDAHGARTARLVRAKERLVKLLEEQKQAIIHRAITRGLDPDVRLNPSGIPWLGDIPAHWKLRKLKQVARLRSGQGITSFQIDKSGEYPVFGGNGLRGYASAYTHDGEYVLIGRQGALCGNINYAGGRFSASEHAVVVHPRAEFVTVWMGELLRLMNLNQYSIAAAQPGLSVERIEALSIPFLPISEQERIVEKIRERTVSIEQALAASRREIALLREFRARLVADVVTGRLDVRAAAAALPETNEALVPLDEGEEPPEESAGDDGEADLEEAAA